MGALKMGKSIIALLLLATLGSFGAAQADELTLAKDAPDQYTVVPGDTLWDISGKFLRDPWRWPDIWGLNKDEVENPHWIYPGEVLILDFTGATPRLRRAGDPLTSDREWNLVNTKLSPTIRKGAISAGAIPSIPMNAIGPFLIRPMFVSPRELAAAPTIIAGPENRVVLSAGDTAFAKGVAWDEGAQWSVIRPARTLVDPDTKEVLGREALYLGDAHVNEFAQISTITVTKAIQEIAPGDRLAKPVSAQQGMSFVPHAPGGVIKGRVIAGPDGSVSEIGSLQVVILNRGQREGVEVGHVLALYHDRPSVTPANATNPKEKVKLPPERYGLVFVFRVFEKVSYALVMNSTRPVNVLDVVQTP
jgi:LysM domain